jgi:hypothetical protein
LHGGDALAQEAAGGRQALPDVQVLERLGELIRRRDLADVPDLLDELRVVERVQRIMSWRKWLMSRSSMLLIRLPPAGVDPLKVEDSMRDMGVGE